MKQQIKVWGSRVLVLAVIVAAGWYWGVPLFKQYFAPEKTETYTPTAKVRKGTFTISLHEIGALEAERSSSVIAQTNGKIISLVADGDLVTSGDILAELDTTDIEREVRNKKLAYENALADVDRAKAELDLLKESNKTDLAQAVAQLDFDKNELKLAREELAKKERLAAEKLIPRSQVDQAKGVVRSKELAVDKGTAQLELKRKEIESKENQKDADIRNVEFKAQMAKIGLEEAERQAESALIRAPSAGLVVIAKDWTPDGRRKLQEGDSVHTRQTICTLPDLSSMLVKANVGESDAPKLRIGMPVVIRLEAVPDKIFRGTVQDIASLAVEPSPWDPGFTPGRKNFEVTVAVKETDPKTLKPGMTADAEFICETVQEAVYVPIEAVVERGGKTYVFVKRGKEYRRTEVTTGKQNDNSVCILRGLDEGQVVALRDPTRTLEEQEAGAEVPESGKKDEKKPAPIPGMSEE